MALPKKGLRNIIVDNVKYAWNTTGNDGWISLSIIPIKQPNLLIRASFGYHSKVVREEILPNGSKAQALKQQIRITGYIIRQVILYAIKTGWDPMGDVAVLNLGAMDDKVDLRIGEAGEL
jgi:hypothetical protein